MKTLLDIDYIIENNSPVIRLFYKDSEKGNFVEYVKNFYPYFYAVPKEENGKTQIENLEKEILNLNKNINKIKAIERVKRIHYESNKEKEILKIYLFVPTDVRDVREIIKTLPSCENIYEYDIPFTERYLIDSEIIPMENAELQNLRICSIDIETYNPKIESRMNIDPILMISYVDNNNAKKVFAWKKCEDCNDNIYIYAENEKAMIEKFLNFIRERNPDIIVTFNGDVYDLQYIKERCKIHKIELNFGDFNGIKKILKFEKRGIDVAGYFLGMPHIDLFPISRQLFSLSQYDLDSVYYEIFKKTGKTEIDKAKIYEIWDKANKDEQAKENLKKLFTYCLRDSEITEEIALALLPLYYEISRIIKLPLYEATRMGSGMRVERLLMTEAFKKNLLIPNKPLEEREIVTYEGGFVLEPEKGLKNNIVIFDFRSLYPSIILSYNIDPNTLNCECCKDEIKDDYVNLNGEKYWFCKKNEGFIPSTLKSLVERRIELKKQMKNEKDPTTKKILDVKQQALKILINSAYGYMGFLRARWYSKECAASVAAYGRKYIQEVIKKARDEGFDVIYGDSLPYNRYVFIKEGKNVYPIKIGELYDKYKNTDKEIFTLSIDEDKKVTFKKILRVIRHNYNGELLKIVTNYGSTVVTPQHSLYSFDYKTKEICLVDASKLKKGDKLISLTNPEIDVSYKEGYVFDLVEMDFGKYSNELMLYSDNLSFSSVYGECPYCKKKVRLSSHVYYKHPERRQSLDKNSSFAWIGGKNKTRKIPRYWVLDKDLAWLLGFYCANGSVSDVLTKSKRRRILSFGSQNEDVIKKVKAILDKKTGIPTKIIRYYDKRINKEMFYYRISGAPIVALFQYGFGAGKGSEFKKVPSFIFTAEESLRKAFIEGYLDGNRNLKKDKRYTTFIQFSTKSKELAIGLDFLLKTLNYGKNVSWQYRKDKPKIQLHLQSARYSKGNFCLAEITSIEKMPNEKYVYDLEVEDVHNFVDAEGMILVHNTDSVFITKKGKIKEEILNDSEKFLKKINETLPGIMELDFEGFYPAGIFVTKKRYALIDEKDKLIVKGLETRRRDWANIAKNVQEEVLRIILKENDPKKAADYVKENVNKIIKGDVKKDDLIIYTRLTRPLDSYIQKKEPHVAAVERAMKKGLTFNTGDIVAYIVTKHGNAINEKTCIAELCEEGDYDANYYINNQILPAVMRIMEVLGFSEDDLKGIKRQTETLF